jgi:hypothetical protein
MSIMELIQDPKYSKQSCYQVFVDFHGRYREVIIFHTIINHGLTFLWEIIYEKLCEIFKTLFC